MMVNLWHSGSKNPSIFIRVLILYPQFCTAECPKILFERQTRSRFVYSKLKFHTSDGRTHTFEGEPEQDINKPVPDQNFRWNFLSNQADVGPCATIRSSIYFQHQSCLNQGKLRPPCQRNIAQSIFFLLNLFHLRYFGSFLKVSVGECTSALSWTIALVPVWSSVGDYFSLSWSAIPYLERPLPLE